MTECPELNTIYDAFESDLFKRKLPTTSTSVNESQSQVNHNNSTIQSSGHGQNSFPNSTSSSSSNQVDQMIDDEVSRRRKRTEGDPLLVRIKVHGRKVGNKATFSCPPGYTVVGTEELICLETGQWSSGMPSCQGIEYNMLPTMLRFFYYDHSFLVSIPVTNSLESFAAF